ncbi:cysteine dioxygenase family protein [Mesorhizobium salmacidum]|uniref:Cysteine dioxygenase family protein n=1 Tax=Mesorhizobium salmacidum TaxID=3015171 RepID=A0ABU8L4K8_9HYPH
MSSIVDGEVQALVAEAKTRIERDGANRGSLADVLAVIERAASLPGRWGPDRYPDPDAGERQARYLIATDPDDSFTLYLNVMRPGNRIPPHNHTTWACIAAVEGAEHNTLYERTDGRTGAGPATLRLTGEVDVRPGRGIALLADDIHAVEIRGEQPIRHLHFYGKALETLSARLMFDLDAGEAKPMKMAVATKK